MRADSELTWDHSSSSSVAGLANPFSLSLSLSLHFTGARRFSPSILPAAVPWSALSAITGLAAAADSNRPSSSSSGLGWKRGEARERARLRTCTKTLARLLLLLRPQQQRQKQEMAERTTDRPRRQLLAAAAAK